MQHEKTRESMVGSSTESSLGVKYNTIHVRIDVGAGIGASN